jgi:hypothetical protein
MYCVKPARLLRRKFEISESESDEDSVPLAKGSLVSNLNTRRQEWTRVSPGLIRLGTFRYGKNMVVVPGGAALPAVSEAMTSTVFSPFIP